MGFPWFASLFFLIFRIPLLFFAKKSEVRLDIVSGSTAISRSLLFGRSVQSFPHESIARVEMRQSRTASNRGPQVQEEPVFCFKDGYEQSFPNVLDGSLMSI
ncbi:MAG: hypothetical protein N3E51_01970 [Candidatus Micrarchaeota archaeon]|nr:hypothetical protein [Candidatus Micrarchaeota archaeon]